MGAVGPGSKGDEEMDPNPSELAPAATGPQATGAQGPASAQIWSSGEQGATGARCWRYRSTRCCWTPRSKVIQVLKVFKVCKA